MVAESAAHKGPSCAVAAQAARLEIDRIDHFRIRIIDLKSNHFASAGFLSLLLATLIFIASLFAFKLSIDEHFAMRQQPIGQQNGADKVAIARGAIFSVGAEGWTAIFTGGLFVFTMLLAGFTYRLFRVTKDGIVEQAALTRESLQKAERSVQAAERALEGSDAPFISVVPEINAVKQKLIGGRISLQFMSGNRLIKYCFINYGKSPAIVMEVYREINVQSKLPEYLAFPPPQFNSFNVEIVGPNKETPRYFIYADETIIAGGDKGLSWADDENRSNDILWILFQVRYRDALGAQFVSANTFAFDATHAEFYPQGGVSHNYRRKLTKDELAAVSERDS